MPGTVIGKSLNLGYAGKVSRNPGNKINSRAVKSILDGNLVETQVPILFGATVVTNADNTYSAFGATGTGVSTGVVANFGGIAVSEVKQAMTYGYGANVGSGQFEPNTACDVLQVGTATVFCKEGTPVANGLVYIVTVAGTTAPLGALVATATPAGSGATAVQLTNARWVSGKMDPSGIAEIVLLTQLNA
ncbi:gp53 minor capsid family protein [Clostridium estertheticum]|uniref:gp53 minor capsid family protein n=1 Tax=Clostridium estertheticum TaxID=238834 RepID=UPI001C7CEEDE|nr:hypothetical protein [Clostridium estertheticum]MBX4259743.1 hypothetical protein [Clostridium estertheticum]MBX4266546.1 hypothetical protein [Clostridium estertheticum]WLC73330.1 hypothetical protein KTC96_24775 [Clostridium estertheticum]WLC88114.1 hypothetical protein KTC95_19165 [Clostridium estertheticum]